MSQVSWDLLSSMSLLDAAVAAPSARSVGDSSGQFNEHLARARSETDAPASSPSTSTEPAGSKSAAKPESASAKPARGKPEESRRDDPPEERDDAADGEKQSAPPTEETGRGKDSSQGKANEAEDHDALDGDELGAAVAAGAAAAESLIVVRPPTEKTVENQASQTKSNAEVAAEQKVFPGERVTAKAPAVEMPSDPVVDQVAVQATVEPGTQSETREAEPFEQQPTSQVAETGQFTEVVPEVKKAPENKAARPKADPQPGSDQKRSETSTASVASKEPVAATTAAQSDGDSSDSNEEQPKKAAAPVRNETPDPAPTANVAAVDATPAAVAARAPVETAPDTKGTGDRESKAAEAITSADQSAGQSSPTPSADAVARSVDPGRTGNVTAGTGNASTSAAAGDDKTEQSRQADRVRFAQRVSRAFEAVGQRNGTIRLKLSPPELGSLRLEIAVQQGGLSARLEAETPAARNLLLESLPELRDRLAQQDIRIDRFDVELMDRRPGGNAQQPGGQWTSGRETPDRSTARRESIVEPAAAAIGGSGAGQAGSDANHLNVII